MKKKSLEVRWFWNKQSCLPNQSTTCSTRNNSKQNRNTLNNDF